MLFILSPAKTLDYETDAGTLPYTIPQFLPQSTELIEILRTKSPQDISELMELSDNLSALNVARYQAWSQRFTKRNSKQAVLAFNGDVYGGLDARTLDRNDLRWAQKHLRILSGLYGVLRPMDRMQPYRLEMGTALANAQGDNLYKFWGTRISEYLNDELGRAKAPIVVNLASQEYFRSVDRKALKAPIVECVFEQFHNGEYKVISFSAKRARGLMARYAVQHRITSPKKLEAFDLEGYAFDKAASARDRLVFRQSGGAPPFGDSE